MASIDKPQPGGRMNESDTDGEGSLSVELRIRQLAKDQLYCVCAQSDGQPCGSIIALALTDDLKQFILETPRATKNYEILTACSNVALAVNNMNKPPHDLMSDETFTSTGIAREIAQLEAGSPWASARDTASEPRSVLLFIFDGTLQG